eukprot:GHVT01069856.1.p2 GENE.GHVT01069856.1~~GHVT01069856.1.p2  ORF type:complete len:125 (-),score=12.56 GHVT01069856.1:750-1124(-)
MDEQPKLSQGEIYTPRPVQIFHQKTTFSLGSIQFVIFHRGVTATGKSTSTRFGYGRLSRDQPRPRRSKGKNRKENRKEKSKEKIDRKNRKEESNGTLGQAANQPSRRKWDSKCRSKSAKTSKQT